jgi:anaerobic selenocysteine-containing dehydrogenase
MPFDHLPTIEHGGLLEEIAGTPGYLRATAGEAPADPLPSSCAFCGVGDTGSVQTRQAAATAPVELPAEGDGTLRVERLGRMAEWRVVFRPGGQIDVETDAPIAPTGAVVSGELAIDGHVRPIVVREIAAPLRSDGVRSWQSFAAYVPALSLGQSTIKVQTPTTGCMKFRISLGHQRPVFPIHTAPSLRSAGGSRTSIGYDEAIARLADLLLAHRPPRGRTLIYACGQVDYFTIFAFQEVFRLLGVRNLAGNAEHCLNSGAVHNEILTGQEGPFLRIEQALDGPNRLFLLNGWNGLVTHPPAFYRICKRADLDAYLVEVAVTESAKMLASKLDPERVLLIRSGGDAHLALAVAHEIFHCYPQAIEWRFVEQYADRATFDRYGALARCDEFSPDRVAERIAPEPGYRDRLAVGIRGIAARLVRPEVVPINIPSVGLSQTKGVVPHCLWGNVLAMLGKYGLKPDGTVAGGTLRIPGQINAETEVQGLSRRAFMGRIPMSDAGAREAARRMGLPDTAYEMALGDTPRAALDYSDDPGGLPELFLCFGTQFESNMMERPRWVHRLTAPGTTLAVVDPIPDPFTLQHAALVMPSPPHVAAAKLYQNGEWRLSLSAPRRRAPAQTRSDATIVYDAMAEIARRLREDERVRAEYPDLAALALSGYLRQRFEPPERGGGLARIDGEVSRPQLWSRVLDYMSGGAGPLYCRPEHADGTPVTWDEILQRGSIVYGGVGTHRYRLDYDNPDHMPFRDLFRRPRRFSFFLPTEQDLTLPSGIVLNSGRSTLSDEKARIRFAVATFNSGKATATVDMPDENPLFVSLPLAARLGLAAGDLVRVTNAETGESLVLPAVPTDRVKGEAVYASFHKCRAEVEHGRYLNTITAHTGRCPYSSQSNFKATIVTLERVPADPGHETP